MACLTIISSSACASLFFPALIARRANKSTCPTRVNEGATRVVIAQLSSIMTSGSRFFAWPFICRTICRRVAGGNFASRGSSSVSMPANIPAMRCDSIGWSGVDARQRIVCFTDDHESKREVDARRANGDALGPDRETTKRTALLVALRVVPRPTDRVPAVAHDERQRARRAHPERVHRFGREELSNGRT
eukprot:29750-Pelagococcus_subviridis.AAC.3